MSKINYRKLAENPDFDLWEFLHALAFSATNPLAKSTADTPPPVRVRGEKAVVVDVEHKQSAMTTRDSVIKIGLLKIEEH